MLEKVKARKPLKTPNDNCKKAKLIFRKILENLKILAGLQTKKGWNGNKDEVF
jgi:hypothetical protein